MGAILAHDLRFIRRHTVVSLSRHFSARNAYILFPTSGKSQNHKYAEHNNKYFFIIFPFLNLFVDQLEGSI